MHAIAHGVDLVEISRIKHMLSAHPERFPERVFTPAERRYAEAGGGRRAERFAARFAAKEAVLKALGTGWRSGISWTEVEVLVRPSGQPVLELHGRCLELASDLGIGEWLISLSHTDQHAIASVIALSTFPRES